jgi:predicted amidophosphoribosyltransferase
VAAADALAPAAAPEGARPRPDTGYPTLRLLCAAAAWCRESVAQPALDVLFPPRCVGCGDFETHLCPACRQSLTPVGEDCCPRCGEPHERAAVGGRCGRCIGKHVVFAGAGSAFVHRGAARKLVAELKFGNQPVLSQVMADLALPAFRDLLAPLGPVVVTWVPSHRSVRRRRGYNQAELLARCLVRGLRAGKGPAHPVQLMELARKTTITKHQQKLDRAARQANLRGAFQLRPSACEALKPDLEKLPEAGQQGRPAIVLVDDVYTTGATAMEMSQMLVSTLALPVYVFTFSRAVSSKREGHD